MSQVLSIAEMLAVEKAAFADGVDPWELMCAAGLQMWQTIRRKYPQPGQCRVYVGKGNNGGDALVVAAGLREIGWQVEVIAPFSKKEMSPLAQKATELWGRSKDQGENLRQRAQPLIIVDGLLGIGVKGEVRAPISEMILAINQARQAGAVVFALDLPSGLGTVEETTVKADHTLTVGFAKDELLADAATVFVGRITILPLDDLTHYGKHISCQKKIATAADLRHLLPPRPFEQHKGQSGRVAIIAGSPGTVGAAVLAANGALRAGAGLVSLYYPPEIHPQLATLLPPEVMARPWGNLSDIAGEKFDVFAVGPGIQSDYFPELLPLLLAILKRGIPLLLDAGALTLLAQNKVLFQNLTPSVLLTPHPGEMERIFPQNKRSRSQWAADFNEKCPATLLLKGARTIVAVAGQLQSYNSTGHPGMATGGMGDTLSGVCAALLGQKLTLYDAARVGAWVCGRAAEIALQEDGQSQESLLPSDLAGALGRAFSDLRLGLP